MVFVLRIISYHTSVASFFVGSLFHSVEDNSVIQQYFIANLEICDTLFFLPP